MVNTEQIRLEQFIKEVFKTKAAFAKALGVHSTWPSAYTGKGKSVIRDQRIIKILESYRFNYQWYLTGDGEMLLNSDVPQITNSKGVPFYPIDITASFLRSFDDIQLVPEFYVDFKPLNDCNAYFTVVGDSMYPKYSSGEIIAIKQINNYDIILWGEAYVVITSEEANNLRTIKLVFQHKDPDYIILRASNPNYPGDIVIKKEHIINMFIIKGRVKLDHL